MKAVQSRPSAQFSEQALRGQLSRADCSIHIATPDRRGLGTGEVDSAGRSHDSGSAAREGAGREGRYASGRSPLARPIHFDIVDWVAGFIPKHFCQCRNHRVASHGGTLWLRFTDGREKGEQDPGGSPGWRVVESEINRRNITDPNSGQSLLAPEGPLINSLGFSAFSGRPLID